jgi:hypothetical protein
VPELNALSRVVNSLSQAEKLGNPSGTARALLVGGTLSLAGERIVTGQPGEAVAIISGSLLAPHIAARLITNPAFVRWLSGTAGSAIRGSNISGDIARLGAVAVANPEIRDEVRQYLDALRTVEADLANIPQGEIVVNPPTQAAAGTPVTGTVPPQQTVSRPPQ